VKYFYHYGKQNLCKFARLKAVIKIWIKKPSFAHFQCEAEKVKAEFKIPNCVKA